MKHGTYDDFWKARNIRAAPEGHQAGRADRGRLVRRREPVRRPGNLQARQAELAQDQQHAGDGPVGPRRLEHGATAPSSGDVSFNAKTAEFYREKIELPFFEYHLKGKGELDPPEAWVFETGTNVWRKYDTWPPKNGPAAVALLPRRRQAASTQPPDDAAPNGLRRIRQRSGQAGAVSSTRSRIGMAPEYMTADQRFAAPPARRAGLRDRRARRGRDPRRADQGRAARLHHRHRLRLGRQADRRLSRRLSRSEPEPDGREAWAATSNWCAAT